jgi:hypothetical protein
MSSESYTSERGVKLAGAGIIFVYFFCGAMISVIYHYLADGLSWFSFLVTACVGPVIVIFLFIFYPLPGWKWRRRLVFYGLAFYLCSPILLNGASLLLNQIGYSDLGRQVYTIRYWALLKGPIFWLLYLAITKIKDFRERKQISGSYMRKTFVNLNIPK